MDETLTAVSTTGADDARVSDGGSQAQIETTPVNAGQSGDESPTTEPVKATPADDGNAAKADKPAQSREENAQIARVRKEAEARVKAEFEAKQAARDAEFAKMAAAEGWKDSSGNPIKTEEAYWREVKYQKEIDRLVTGGKDPEDARLRVEYERLKEEREAEKQAKAEEARKQAENQAFFDFYREVNGKEFTSADEIPDEVFRNAQENKVPLKYAYAEYRAKAEREKEKNIALGKQAAEVNAKNAESSTGSVTGNGQADNSVLTEESISAMSPKEMERRWGDIKKFYKMK